MTHPKISRPSNTSVDRLIRRVDETIAQCRRFEEVAAIATTWAHRWPASKLERWLNADERCQSDRETALVALALTATSEAGSILESYDPTGYDHELFYDIACIEWKQRHREKTEHRCAA